MSYIIYYIAIFIVDSLKVKELVKVASGHEAVPTAPAKKERGINIPVTIYLLIYNYCARLTAFNPVRLFWSPKSENSLQA